ncbi:MAG: DUF6293 family protein [Candidatus Heimdallarchaeum aukensis]|uniref:DUF6293 family protein n=1 Tax=Candidatus Heimdallarchaeum aukensis TaxID=2876573 RepID=A0A9Y1BKG7_9ARCH|nr:MAG: DUF6293 family protein [Candidatus Heimdallarchaeum aukensis]
MRNVHIMTVGLTPKPIIEGINAYQIDDIFLLYNEGSKTEANSIRALTEKLFINCTLVEVDKFDLEDVVVKILSIIKKNIGNRIHINITGGTKIMSSAGVIAGFFSGSEIYYIKEPKNNDPLSDRIIKLPIPKVQLDDIKDNAKKILTLILERGGKICSANSEISDVLNIRPQLVSYYINKLEKENLIENKKEGRNNIIKLTNAGRFAAKYFTIAN